MFDYVSLNQGSVEFSKMICKVKGRKIYLPVEISYSSAIRTGHDLDKQEGQSHLQRATWAGLGFDLDMPFIERIVAGGPDGNAGTARDYPADDFPLNSGTFNFFTFSSFFNGAEIPPRSVTALRGDTPLAERNSSARKNYLNERFRGAATY